MPDVFIPCDEEPIYIPNTECDACEAFLEALEDKEDKFTVGDGLEMSANRVLSAERNASNTYTKQEVDELIDTGGEFTAGTGITIANQRINAQRNPNNTYTKAEVDAMVAGTGGALPVGTIIHSTSNTAPSLEGTWQKVFSLSDGFQYNNETSTGFYIAVVSNNDGPVMTVVVPGLHESGATEADISLGIDFGQSAGPQDQSRHMIFIANGVRYSLEYATNFEDDMQFRVRNIYGDTVQFDTHGIFPRSSRGQSMTDYTSGMCRFRGLYVRCTKPLFYWKRVS